MNKTIIIGICICLIVLVGCDDKSNFSTKAKLVCNDICMNEKLNLDYVTGTGDTLFCHCERIISIPNT